VHEDFPGPDDIGEILIDEGRLQDRIRQLGEQLTRDYVGRDPVLVTVLKGALPFVADLMRAVALPLELDVMAVSSYGDETKSSGIVKIVKDLDTSITGRHVLLVEDIVDSGLTLRYLLEHLGARHPASLATVSLLAREGRQHPGITVDYVGFEIPDAFVIGYGLDVAQRYRNLPYIATYSGTGS
jgi:hypoxanthine phosphoribosyltransferase